MKQQQPTDQPSAQQQANQSPSKWIYIGSGGLLLALVGSYFLIPAFHHFVNKTYQVLTSNDHQRISNYMKGFGFWGPAVVIFAMVVQMFLIVVPSWLLMIIAVLAYGQVWGVVLSVASVFIASTVGYFIGKLFSEATLYKLLGKKTEQKMKHYIDQYGFGAVLVFRLAPFLSNDAISFVGGMLRMSYWKFIGATLAGIIPLSILIAFFSENTKRLESGMLWIGGASLLLYAGYVFYEQKHKNKGS